MLPDRESALALAESHQNRFGDVAYVMPESEAMRPWQEDQLRQLFTRMAKSGGGDILRMENSANELGDTIRNAHIPREGISVPPRTKHSSHGRSIIHVRVHFFGVSPAYIRANSGERANMVVAYTNERKAAPPTAHSTPTARATAPAANAPTTCDSPTNTNE